MTVGEYARKVKTSRYSVYRWIKIGSLPPWVEVKSCCGKIDLIIHEDKRPK